MALIIFVAITCAVLLAGVGLVVGLWLGSPDGEMSLNRAASRAAEFFPKKQPKEQQDNTLKFSRRLTQAQFERQAEEAKLREMEEGRG